MCQVGEVLVQLCQSGNVKYMEWTYAIPCSSVSAEALQDLISRMSSDLSEWQSELARSRRRVYELNYFTTPQLLVLRDELYRASKDRGCTQRALALLRSISPGISEAQVLHQLSGTPSLNLRSGFCYIWTCDITLHKISV